MDASREAGQRPEEPEAAPERSEAVPLLPGEDFRPGGSGTGEPAVEASVPKQRVPEEPEPGSLSPAEDFRAAGSTAGGPVEEVPVPEGPEPGLEGPGAGPLLPAKDFGSEGLGTGEPVEEAALPEQRVPAEAVPGEPVAEAGADEPAGPPIADQSQRLVARIVDTLIVGAPVAGIASELFDRQTAQTIVAPVGFAAVFLVYEIVQLALWGRTLGKRLTRIRVVSADGARLRVPQVIVRALVYTLPPVARPVPILNVLAGLFLVANGAMTFDRPYRQALHDRAAGTLVIRD